VALGLTTVLLGGCSGGVAQQSASRPSDHVSSTPSGLVQRHRLGLSPELVIPVTHTVVYLAGTRWRGDAHEVQLLRSNDGGLHFQAVTAPPSPSATLRNALGDPGSLVFPTPVDGYAVVGASWARRSLWMTIDGARTWHPVRFGWGTGVIAVNGSGGRVYAVVRRCASTRDCPAYRIYRSVTGSSRWLWSAGPDSGLVTTAGGIGLTSAGSAVWLTVGNGSVSPWLYTSNDAGQSFHLDATLTAISCALQPTSARIVWLDCSTGMLDGFYRSQDGGRHPVKLPVAGAGTANTSWIRCRARPPTSAPPARTIPDCSGPRMRAPPSPKWHPYLTGSPTVSPPPSRFSPPHRARTQLRSSTGAHRRRWHQLGPAASWVRPRDQPVQFVRRPRRTPCPLLAAQPARGPGPASVVRGTESAGWRSSR
jgi:hypothetical protein